MFSSVLSIALVTLFPATHLQTVCPQPEHPSNNPGHRPSAASGSRVMQELHSKAIRAPSPDRSGWSPEEFRFARTEVGTDGFVNPHRNCYKKLL